MIISYGYNRIGMCAHRGFKLRNTRKIGGRKRLFNM